ncbi:MAG: hypothetical protein ABI305_06765 [Tepidiformaceae bacterium]
MTIEAEPSTKAAAPKSPKWELEVKDRLRAALRSAHKSLPSLIAADAVEGNTRMFVTEFLCNGLGFDMYEDLTAEYQVKGEFADYGIRIDKQLVAFVEVKRVATKLVVKHLRQVEMYAINEGVEWAILTNGHEWEVYHLAAKPISANPGPLIEVDLTFSVNLLSDETPAKKIEKLFYVTRESLKRRQIDELWRAKRATSPKSVAQAVQSDAVLDALRRELRKTTGHNANLDELKAIIRSSVLRSDCL